MSSAAARSLVTFLTVLVTIGCGSEPTAPAGRLSHLIGAQVPETVAPGTGFRVVGYFGRGACDEVTRVVEPSTDGVRLSLLGQAEVVQGPCIDMLVTDSVVANIAPSAPRPFTVQLRAAGRDSIIVVRAP